MERKFKKKNISEVKCHIRKAHFAVISGLDAKEGMLQFCFLYGQSGKFRNLRQDRWPASQNNLPLNVSMATVIITLEEATVDYHYIHWGCAKD